LFVWLVGWLVGWLVVCLLFLLFLFVCLLFSLFSLLLFVWLIVFAHSEPTARVAGYVISLQQILDQTQQQQNNNNNNGRLTAEQQQQQQQQRLFLQEAIDEIRKLVMELQQSHKVSSNISTMLGVYNELGGFPG
jgi:hypothetical protein